MYKAFKGKLDFHSLLIGSLLPDLEIPILYFLGFSYPYDRLVLHSFMGSLMFSWVLGLALYRLYKVFMRKLLNYELRYVSLTNLITSIELGSLGHVFIDTLHHPYNPLLWPLSSESVDVFVLFGDYEVAMTFMHALFMLLFIAIACYELRQALIKVRSLRYVGVRSS